VLKALEGIGFSSKTSYFQPPFGLQVVQTHVPLFTEQY